MSAPTKAVKPSAAEADFAIGPRVVFGGLMIALLLVGGGGWAATADLSGAIVAPGTVVVDRNVKKVQHLDGGIVAEINVREGERVQAGQVVVRLDDTQTRGELGVIQSQLIELTGRKARLAAERDGFADIRFPPGFASLGPEAENIREGELRLFTESRKTRESQKEQLTHRIGQLKEEIVGFTAQRQAKSVELELIGKELEQVSSLADRQLTPISRVYAMTREKARLGGEHGSLIAQIARAGGQISEVNLQIIAIDQNVRTEAQKELRAIEARMAELTERQAVAKDRLNRVEIRAPQAGIVHELAAHTIGGVVTPASQIMVVVPENEDLTIEVRLSPVDIDQVVVGQVARLRFTAFNQRTTPEAWGKISRVAADVTIDPKTGASYYSGRVAVDPDPEGRAPIRLVPGMPVEVFIATEQRTAISYFLKPLTDQFTRAFREE